MKYLANLQTKICTFVLFLVISTNTVCIPTKYLVAIEKDNWDVGQKYLQMYKHFWQLSTYHSVRIIKYFANEQLVQMPASGSGLD